MPKVPFKVSARAGKLLGRENFSNPEGAIIELVKNSYDADAKNCLVLFNIPLIKKIDSKGNEYDVPVKEDSIIYIIDNGEGMTETIVSDYWMQIGTGNKEKDFISDDKRVKTGAKGIGRFALDRLGFETEMWTLSKTEIANNGSHWKMDWNQFDDSDKVISQIEADLEQEKIDLTQKIKSFPFQSIRLNDELEKVKFKSGTILKISNLKDDWYDSDIGNVFRSLEALIPPKELNISFEVYFNHLQKPKEYGVVETAFFDDFDYKLKASYDSESLEVAFEITRNELDLNLVKKNYSSIYDKLQKPFDLKTLEAKTFYYKKGIDKVLKWKLDDNNKKLLKDVGSFDLTFYYLKFSNSSKEGYPYKKITPAERRSVLDKFGGVKVYRDSFRVRPYGEPTDDWLKLGARVAQSPAGAGQRIGDWRVRPEQTAGIITISRKVNPLLIDKSDRGALQENDAFDVFKTIIVGVIHEFEFDRTKILNPLYLYFQKEKEKAKEIEIQNRAEVLADKIIEERKKVDEAFYGKRRIDLFDQQKEDEERKTYENAFTETFKAIDEENEQRANEEIVQVRALASLGLIISSFAHELREVKNNTSEIEDLKEIFVTLIPKEFKDSIKYNDGINILDLLNDNSEKIKHWIEYTLTAIKKDKRKRNKLIFSDYFYSLKNTWKKILQSKNINLYIIDKIDAIDYDFRAFEMDMNTIFINLINNSLDSFDALTNIQDRNICISLELIQDSIEIIYSDNGGGIDDIFVEKDDIFLPFTTAKKDRHGNEVGTGLGMYLVKNVIDDNSGHAQILEPEKGFSIKISFLVRKN